MAKIICTLKEFTYFVDPRIRINVTNMTRQSKNLLESRCQKCNEKKVLDAAHKHGSTRKEIIKNVLSNHSVNDEQYEIENLQKIIDEINNAHLPIVDHFIFLCKSCHREYDSWTKNLNHIESKENILKTQNQSALQSKKEYSILDNKQDSIMENLCRNETQSWKYKMGWTSIENRMNLDKIISKIESDFDCYPISFKSWYYHNRKDNNKQFSGIICHKKRSEICFRINPDSFDIVDSRIIHGKRWFFSEGKEKRINIIPENYELIMKCLYYAYDISR